MALVIESFRGGMGRRHPTFAILSGVEDAEQAKRLAGQRVETTLATGQRVQGRVVKPFGKGMKVLAHFEKGLPGDALGARLELVKSK